MKINLPNLLRTMREICFGALLALVAVVLAGIVGLPFGLAAAGITGMLSGDAEIVLLVGTLVGTVFAAVAFFVLLAAYQDGDIIIVTGDRKANRERARRALKEAQDILDNKTTGEQQ